MPTSAWQRLLFPFTLPMSWLYGLGVAYRNRGFDQRPSLQRKLSVPVISVGNITAGGSGKTPLTAAIARELLARNERVAVASRGYGREGKEPYLLVSDGNEVRVGVERAGDEPLELALGVPGLAVAVGGDRFRVGTELVSNLDATAILLDDGFQHRGLARDLDIVCMDAGEPETSLRLLPAGRLREPLSNLARADAFVWTRFRRERLSAELSERVQSHLREGVPVLVARQQVIGYSGVGFEEHRPPGSFRDEPVGVLVALARPERLREELDARVVHWTSRRDHHPWGRRETEEASEVARARGARALLTTRKDVVKLARFVTHEDALSLPLYVIDAQTVLDENPTFEALLLRVMNPRK